MFGITGYGMLVLSVASAAPEMEKLPSCGVMAVYTIAHHYQIDSSLQQVESLLSNGTGREEHYSMEHLRLAVRSLGLHARSIRVTSESLDRLHCPSIIFIRPDKFGPDQKVGHFAVLQSVSENNVRLMDLTLTPEPWNVPRESLFAGWDGECLEISETSFLIPSAGLWRTMCAFMACFAAILLWRSVAKRRPMGKLAMVCLLWGAAGCQEQVHPGPGSRPLVSFDERTFSAGTVPRGPDAKVRCSFVVGEQKIVIKSIDSGCGCISPDNQLVGQELLPGTAHSFVVTLSTDGRFAKAGGTLMVLTEPPSPQPLQCHVSAYVDGPPEPVGTLPVQVETTFGEVPVTEIRLAHFRGDDQQPIEWDERRSDLAGLSVMRTDFSSEPNSPTLGAMAGSGNRDLFRWTLRLPENLPIGSHSFQLKMAWKHDSYPPQPIPIKVLVRHTLRTSNDRVFFGVIEQGMPRVVDVNVTNWNAEQMRAMQVDCDSRFITAVLDPQSGTIRVRLSELAPSGRLQANVHVRQDQQSPELILPVTAVISDRKNVSSSAN